VKQNTARQREIRRVHSHVKRTLSPHPSVFLHQRGSHWTDFREISYRELARKSVEKLQIWLKSDKKFTCRHFYILTYLLTQWSRVLLEKLTGFAASQEIPRIYGTWKFITVLSSARQLSLSWARSIQSPQPPPISWRSILILSSHLRLGLPNCLVPSRHFYIVDRKHVAQQYTQKALLLFHCNMVKRMLRHTYSKMAVFMQYENTTGSDIFSFLFFPFPDTTRDQNYGYAKCKKTK
jgi:hypothetical protein